MGNDPRTWNFGGNDTKGDTEGDERERQLRIKKYDNRKHRK